MERLETLPNGRLLYRFKHPWRDGTTHIVMEPLEMLEKLAALVPAPKAHLVRYSGILAPAAKWRASIVPGELGQSASIPASCATESSHATELLGPEPVQSRVNRHGRNYTWAELMKRVWALDVLECPRCRSRMRILAAIHPPDAIRKILDCLGLPSRAPPLSPAFSEFTAPIE